MIVTSKKDYNLVSKQIGLKNKILLKPVHPVFQTEEDLKKNIIKKDKVVLGALKGIVIKGQKEFVEVIENITVIKAY